MQQSFKVIIVGLGIQGRKRFSVAGSDVVGVVDPYNTEADWKSIDEVPLSKYDAALLCIPDNCKINIIKQLISKKKHVLVEKPLLSTDLRIIKELENIAKENNVTCYTAYNHRFEPHFVRMKDLIKSGVLGKIYHCRLFYGNGTAQDVKNSPWRDKEKKGVLADLGSHLLDTFLFWFDDPDREFYVKNSNKFENKAWDHVIIGSDILSGKPSLEMEMTLLSWRNHFMCDIIAEQGSAHIESLCKWGPSKFTYRRRKFPSGRPDEESITLVQPDPTWDLEYKHFKKLCLKGQNNIKNDAVLSKYFNDFSKQLRNM